MVGTGFMSFWAGDRMATVWKALGSGVNQAHNGYLEQYLNLGYIGVAFIIGIALSSLFVVVKQLKSDYSVGVLRLCVLTTAMLYNYTEASFYGINLMWVLFLAASIDVPHVQVMATAAERPLRIVSRRAPVKLTNQTPVKSHAATRRAARQPRQTRLELSSWANRDPKTR
jgi:O-antigen ligase